MKGGREVKGYLEKIRQKVYTVTHSYKLWILVFSCTKHATDLNNIQKLRKIPVARAP
jgi:hypothetical protein